MYLTEQKSQERYKTVTLFFPGVLSKQRQCCRCRCQRCPEKQNQNTEESIPQVTEEQNASESDDNDNAEAEEALNSLVEADNAEQEQTATRTTTIVNNNNVVRKIARKRINSGAASTTVVARTPLTPASTTLLTSGSPVFRTVAAVPQFAAAPLRGAVVQRGPLTYSLAGTVSSGYYSYPGYGVAYEF